MDRGVCVCSGDYSCYRFDDDKGNKFHEMSISGSCAYTMVTNACSGSDELPPDLFVIDVVFERESMNIRGSYAKVLHITNVASGEFESYVLKQGYRVIHNAIRISVNKTPTVYDGFSAVQIVESGEQTPDDWDVSGNLIKITFENGYDVLWDGVKMFKIIAPIRHQEETPCGLCGNNDGQRPDIRTGPHNEDWGCPGKQVDLTFQSQAPNQQTLINSWYSEITSDSEACQLECL
ncbi:hypothetical protein CAPTEDRAFT_220185 [Capitella teleta]|uniref:VWFD domain-containing protein n=1 Tax=Capitella teleta TaxID=283909 RepID=R7VIM6_CAPTE|nr:hypothetical protein CAPTEDRAFT_220185 [Capitella teleta]|eukprot:ELU15570.1 hypothetical protein CAPTEDRAFT_220185 [Capitella teleta]